MSKEGFHYKHNRLQQLRGFCHVARTGSISKAAKAMGLSQPSVSLQIKALEEDLGVELLERRDQRMSLTEHGQLLLKLALPHVEPLDRLRDTFFAAVKRQKPEFLTIGANQPTLMYLLPRLVKHYCDFQSDIKVKLKYAETPDIYEMLRREEIDFMIGTSPKNTPGDLCYIPIYEFETNLIMPKDHPLVGKKNVSLEEITSYPLILPTCERHTVVGIDVVISRYGAKSGVRVELEDWELVRHYVEEGLGLSIISAAGWNDEPKLHTISLKRYFPNVTYGLTMLEGKPIPQHVTDFIETMREVGKTSKWDLV